MADNDVPVLPPPSPEHRRIAAGRFEHANQAITAGNYDYGIQLLLTCCKLDPANLIYRQVLRRTEKAKYKNNLRGSRLALLTTSPLKARLKAAKRGRDYLKVLEYGERVLVHNPWDSGAQMDMAEAAEFLGLTELAVWTLDQARQKDPNDVTVNRALARLCERQGYFTQAIRLWELVRKLAPGDLEAQQKAMDLAASETIARGHYEEVVGTSGEAWVRQAGKTSEPVLTELGRISPVEDRIVREATALRERLDADPTNPQVYLQLANLCRRSGEIEEARQVLEEGLGPTGNAFELTLELAELDIEPFRRDLALTEDKLRVQPQDKSLRKFRLRLLREINTRELDLYREKAERYPTEMGHRFELGVRLLRAGQLDEAIRELQTARADPRHHWRALLYLGYCFKSRNNWPLARRNFDEALQSLPTGEDATRKQILFELAQGCAEAGDLARAVEFALELANLDFAYRDIGRLLDQWQARLQANVP